MKKERLDAVRITGLDGFHAVAPYVMPKRTEAEVSSTETFDITDLCAFMEKRNREQGTNLKLFHAFCTAVARTIFLRSKMNVFISGRRYWQRKDITLSFVAKRKFEDSAEEVLILMKVEPEMTVEHVSRLILGDVSDVRQNKTNDVGSTMDFLAKMPRFAMEIIFAVVRMLEYKLARRGKVLIKVDKWYPSSQICHCCGTLHPEMKNLAIRKMICDCGLTMSRDQNAAINILNEGLRVLKESA